MTSKRATRLRTIGPVVTLAGLVAASPVSGQNPDSLVKLLDASNWQTRSAAVAQLNQLPESKLPSRYADKVIPLLEREATNPDPDASGPGEGYGQYEIKLMRGVLRLQDPRSLRALALNGIEMSREAKEFVASFGSRALPHLRDSWDLTEANRYAVVQTWGLMLSRHRDRLTDRDAARVLANLLDAAPDEPLAVARVANQIPLTTVLPFLTEYADTVQNSLARRRASEVASRLRDRRRDMRLEDIATAVRGMLDALCLDPEPGPKRGACRSLENRLSTARRHIKGGRSKPARNVLESYVREVEQAHRKSAFTDAERTLLVGNAEALIERLRGAE